MPTIDDPIAKLTVESSAERPLVLLVEDNEVIRSMTCDILRIGGYQVVAAASGAEALEAWHRMGSSVRIVVTDVNLGGSMDGPELALSLRKLRPSLPIILTSGSGKCSVTRASEFHYVQKPYSGSILREAIALAIAA